MPSAAAVAGVASRAGAAEAVVAALAARRPQHAASVKTARTGTLGPRPDLIVMTEPAFRSRECYGIVRTVTVEPIVGILPTP